MESFRSNSSKNNIVNVNTLNESQIDKFVHDVEKNVDMESLRVLLTVRTLFFFRVSREFTSTHTHTQSKRTSTQATHVLIRLLLRVNDREALSVGKELHLILSRSDGAYSDDLARRLLRPLLEQQNHDNISRVIDLMPAALASTPQYRDELLESIFKAKWSSSLLLPIASGLVDLQDMLQSSSSSLSSSHWASIRVKLLNHLARKDFEAADYAGVIRLLLRLLVRLDQEEWFDVVRKTLHHVPVMSWRNVSYIISITCQQSNRLSRLIVEGLGRLAEGEENSVMTYTDLILMLAAAKGLDDVRGVRA